MDNKKELSIMMTDGTKKMEFKTNDFNSEYQLAVMSGMFQFFDIDVDFAEMIEIYHKTGKAYQEFYGDKKEPALTEVNEKIVRPERNEEFKQQYENALTTETEEEKPVYTNTKVRNGVTLYKCHYICPRCGNRGNKYMTQFDKTVNCHDCQQLMPTHTATENGNLEQDVFGNFFIAGEFKRKTEYTPPTTNEEKEEEK